MANRFSRPSDKLHYPPLWRVMIGTNWVFTILQLPAAFFHYSVFMLTAIILQLCRLIKNIWPSHFVWIWRNRGSGRITFHWGIHQEVKSPLAGLLQAIMPTIIWLAMLTWLIIIRHPVAIYGVFAFGPFGITWMEFHNARTFLKQLYGTK